MIRCLLKIPVILGFSISLGGCQHRLYLTYNTFGQADPIKSQEVVDEFNRLRNTGVSSKYQVYTPENEKDKAAAKDKFDLNSIIVFDSTVPEGVDVSGGNITATGAGIKVLGRFNLGSSASKSRTYFIKELKYLAQFAGGNLVITQFTSEMQQVFGASGYILWAPSPESLKGSPKGDSKGNHSSPDKSDEPREKRRDL